MMKKKLLAMPFAYKFILSVMILIVSFMASLILGAADTSIHDIWLALTTSKPSDAITIIREFRLPREVAAVLVGAALAVSGAIMQGLTRNPLAGPGLLGLTAGANAALAITAAFAQGVGTFWMMIACFIGAAAGMGLVFGVSSMKKGGFSPFRIVLAGAAISAFLTAISEGIGIYFHVAKYVSMWTSGGLLGVKWHHLQVILPFIVIGIILAMFLARHLTVLSLSQDIALGLGQKTTQIKIILFIIIVILAGAAVALVGNIAFFGLMIPHIVRSFTGSDYRLILPMSAMIGAIFMVWADTVARTLYAPYEIPIIAVISIIGLPFFLYIVRKGVKAFS